MRVNRVASLAVTEHAPQGPCDRTVQSGYLCVLQEISERRLAIRAPSPDLRDHTRGSQEWRTGIYETIHEGNHDARAALEGNENPRVEHYPGSGLQAAPRPAPRLVKRLKMLSATATSRRVGFTSR